MKRICVNVLLFAGWTLLFAAFAYLIPLADVGL